MATEYPATPGLDEARQGRPWWKVCCVGCFATVILIIVGGAVIWRGVGGGSGPQVLAELPSNFPASLSLYRMDQASSIVYLSGKEKQRTFSALLAPFKFFRGSEPVTANSTSTATMADALEARNSLVAKADTVTVTWKNLQASRADLISFYQDEFERNDYTVRSSHDDVSQTDLIVASRSDVALTLRIQDLADIPGIDTITANVDYIHE